MIYILSQYWTFIALALLLGMFIGWSTRGGAQEPARWLYPALGAWAVGLVLAIFKIVPGVLGHALEVALLLFAVYIVGCFAGSVAGERKDDERVNRLAVAGAAGSSGGVKGAAAERKAVAEPTSVAETKSSATVPGAPPRADENAAQEKTADDKAADAKVAGGMATNAIAAPAPQAAASSAAEHSSRAMTDGQRSLVAQQKKQAERAARAAAAPPVAAEPQVTQAAPEASAAPAQAPARAIEPARQPMTDGARTLAVLKRKEEERALRRAAAAAQAEAVSSEAAAGTDATHGVRPSQDENRQSPADDLKLIKGVGPKNAAILDGIAIRRFAQIADWSPANARWVGAHMSFPGRVEREHWIAQAKLLAAGVDTEHSSAVKAGRIIVDESADAPLGEAEAMAFAQSLPKQAERVEGEESHAGARPLGLAAARGDGADDLKLIKGIGPQNEARLHALGVWHFDQIAAWSPENVKWIGSYLAFSGRIDREKWIEQARALASGGASTKDPASRLI